MCGLPNLGVVVPTEPSGRRHSRKPGTLTPRSRLGTWTPRSRVGHSESALCGAAARELLVVAGMAGIRIPAIELGLDQRADLDFVDRDVDELAGQFDAVELKADQASPYIAAARSSIPLRSTRRIRALLSRTRDHSEPVRSTPSNRDPLRTSSTYSAIHPIVRPAQDALVTEDLAARVAIARFAFSTRHTPAQVSVSFGGSRSDRSSTPSSTPVGWPRDSRAPTRAASSARIPPRPRARSRSCARASSTSMNTATSTSSRSSGLSRRLRGRNDMEGETLDSLGNRQTAHGRPSSC
jgi:hypothetical protein